MLVWGKNPGEILFVGLLPPPTLTSKGRLVMMVESEHIPVLKSSNIHKIPLIDSVTPYLGAQRMFISEYTTKIIPYSDISERTLKQVCQMRCDQFIGRLKWNIESYKGGDEEADQFDTAGTYYLTLEHRDFLVGSVRMRPSYIPNMTNTYFHGLTAGSTINRFATWEASRFNIASDNPKNGNARNSASFINKRTIILFLAMIEYGLENGFEGYEVIVDPLMKRILSLTGWKGMYLASGKGSFNENIYYGILPCSFEALSVIAGKYYSYRTRVGQLETGGYQVQRECL